MKSDFWKSQDGVSPTTSGVGRNVEDQKGGEKKRAGKSIGERKKKIHAGLNKLRSSAGEF